MIELDDAYDVDPALDSSDALHQVVLTEMGAQGELAEAMKGALWETLWITVRSSVVGMIRLGSEIVQVLIDSGMVGIDDKVRQRIVQATAEAILYQLPGDLHRRMKKNIWHLLSSSKSVASVSMAGAESPKTRTAPLDTRSRSRLWEEMKDIIPSTIQNVLSYPV